MTTITSATTGPPPQGLAFVRPATATTVPALQAQPAATPAARADAPNDAATPSMAVNKVSVEDVKRIRDSLQSRFNQIAPELQISVDQSSGRTVIKFTDRSTNKVIRQFPTEEALQLNKDLERFQKGLLLNKNA